MLASFAAYNLWLDWRLYAPHLGRCFLDYEPGIHYPQLQMQAGVTGINALRVYSVTKQAKDHDPTGEFIKAWLPELRNVPVKYIQEPWLMPQHVQATVGVLIVPYPALPSTLHSSSSTASSHPSSSPSPTTLYYPQLIVDEVQTARVAKERMGAVIRTIKAESQTVFKKHGSRMGPRKSGNRSEGDTNKVSPSQSALDVSKVRRIDDAFKVISSSSSGSLSSPPTTGSSSILSQGHMITTPSSSSSSSRLTGDRESKSKPLKSGLYRFFSSHEPINTSQEVIILTSDDENEDDINFEPYTHNSSSSQPAYTTYNDDVISLSDTDSVNDEAVDLPHSTVPYSVPAESTVTWTCNICTYINRYITTNRLCEMCGSCYGMK